MFVRVELLIQLYITYMYTLYMCRLIATTVSLFKVVKVLLDARAEVVLSVKRRTSSVSRL